MIKEVIQGKNECVLACVAMVTGEAIEYVREVYAKDASGGVSLLDEILLLDKLGFNPIVCSPVLGGIMENRVYIVTVPSRTQGMHRIVIDNKFFQPACIIYDPIGRDNPLAYTDFDEVKLCFSDVTEIPYMITEFYKFKDGLR